MRNVSLVCIDQCDVGCQLLWPAGVQKYSLWTQPTFYFDIPLPQMLPHAGAGQIWLDNHWPAREGWCGWSWGCLEHGRKIPYQSSLEPMKVESKIYQTIWVSRSRSRDEYIKLVIKATTMDYWS